MAALQSQKPVVAAVTQAEKAATQAEIAAADALVFDLDGTLIDTHGSFDTAICRLVERHTGQAPEAGAIEALQAQGGFNDSWDKARELIARRGKEIDRDALVKEGQEIYFQLGQAAEVLLIEHNDLVRLGRHYRLFVFSGRTRSEFDRTWGPNLSSFFEAVFCRDDIAGYSPKPHPDYLIHIAREHGVNRGVYIGNTVDDMECARQAQYRSIAVTSVHSGELLCAAGAEVILPSVAQLSGFLGLPD